MSNAICTDNNTNIIPESVTEFKFTKDGKVKQTKNNRVKGKSTEVYPLKSKEEISAVIRALDRKIEEAHNNVEFSRGWNDNHNNQLRNAYRNKLIWLVGINIGVRASDLLELKWSFFFDMDDNRNIIWHDFYRFMPKKTNSKGKYVKLYFNSALKRAIEEYLAVYPITKDSLDSYMFTSNRGNHITSQQLWNIICDTATKADLKQNVGTNTLRKTWAFHCWHDAADKDKALVMLQKCFNHSSTQATLIYIDALDDEILDDEIRELCMSIGLGVDNM